MGWGTWLRANSQHPVPERDLSNQRPTDFKFGDIHSSKFKIVLDMFRSGEIHHLRWVLWFSFQNIESRYFSGFRKTVFWDGSSYVLPGFGLQIPGSGQIQSVKVEQIELPGVGSDLSEERRKVVSRRPHHWNTITIIRENLGNTWRKPLEVSFSGKL